MEDLPDDLRDFLKQQKREYTAKVSGPSAMPRTAAPNVQPQPEPLPFHLADADEVDVRNSSPAITANGRGDGQHRLLREIPESDFRLSRHR